MKAAIEGRKDTFWARADKGELEDVEEDEEGEGTGEGDSEMEDGQAQPREVDLCEEELITPKDQGWLAGLATWKLGVEAERRGERFDNLDDIFDDDDEEEEHEEDDHTAPK